jgi:uroporphyrinogen decarboxylase
MAALNHEEPDRVPIDVGGTGLTNINLMAYGRLKKLLGIDEGMARVFHSWIQVPELEKVVADRLHSDTVTLPRHRMCLGIPNVEFKPWTHAGGTEFLYPVDYNPKKNAEGDWEWYEHGEMIAKAPGEGTHGFALYKHPLSELSSEKEIDDFFESYTGNFVGRLHVDDAEIEWATAFARDLYENTDKCVIADFFGTVLENAQGIVGWDEIYVRMISEPDIAKYFLERLTDTLLEALKRYIPAVRDYVQVLVFADDIGQQQGPMLDPDMYREFLFPCHEKLFRYVRDNSDIKVFFHTDGAVSDLLPHLIEAGIQIFNTVQTDAANMDPAILKREFGKDLVFWGGGVDTHRTLPRGTPGQVREDVRRRMQVLAPGGGYVFSSVHNILSDIQPENIVALFDAALEYGQYPIQVEGQSPEQLQQKHQDYWPDPLERLKAEGVA